MTVTPPPQVVPNPKIVTQCTINSVDLGLLVCTATVAFDDGTTQQIQWPITLVTPGPDQYLPLGVPAPPGPPSGP